MINHGNQYLVAINSLISLDKKPFIIPVIFNKLLMLNIVLLNICRIYNTLNSTKQITKMVKIKIKSYKNHMHYTQVKLFYFHSKPTFIPI